MQSPRVYFNNIGSICTDSLRHGNGLSALIFLTRAAKSSAAKSSASKTCSMESRLYVGNSKNLPLRLHCELTLRLGGKRLDRHCDVLCRPYQRWFCGKLDRHCNNYVMYQRW